MDNCSIHHVNSIKEPFNDAGISYLDLNCIEFAFSSIKYYLKDCDEILRSVNNPLPIVKAAFHDSVLKNVNHGFLLMVINTYLYCTHSYYYIITLYFKKLIILKITFFTYHVKVVIHVIH